MKISRCPSCDSKRINAVPMASPGYETESYYCMDCGKEFAIKLRSKKVEQLYFNSEGDMVTYAVERAKKPVKKRRMLLGAL